MIGMQLQPMDATLITEDDAIPTTENDRHPRIEATSTDHEICSPSILPQIIEDHESTQSSDDSDNESDDGTIYDIDLLEHDPGLRPPLLNAYAANE
jgi:hypothetical protein